MNNKFFIFVSLFLLLLISPATSIFFILDPSENRCMSRDMPEKSIFSGVYFVSGEREEDNKAYIMNERGHILWQAQNQKTGNFHLDIAQAGTYSLCHQSLSPIQLTISFEFYDEKKDEQLISVHNIENLNSVIHTIRRKLDIIHSNMRNSAVRRGAHLDISNSINSKISFYTLIKVVFLILFSVFQIMMLTSIFGNVKVVSKISVTEMSSHKNTNNPTETSVFL